VDIQIILVGHKSDKVDIRTVTEREGELVICIVYLFMSVCMCVYVYVLSPLKLTFEVC